MRQPALTSQDGASPVPVCKPILIPPVAVITRREARNCCRKASCAWASSTPTHMTQFVCGPRLDTVPPTETSCAKQRSASCRDGGSRISRSSAQCTSTYSAVACAARCSGSLDCWGFARAQSFQDRLVLLQLIVSAIHTARREC